MLKQPLRSCATQGNADGSTAVSRLSALGAGAENPDTYNACLAATCWSACFAPIAWRRIPFLVQPKVNGREH